MLTVINASATATLLEQRPEKNSGSERDSGTHDLYRCSALPTELSKPHESDCMRVSPLYVDVILGPSIVNFNFTLYYTWAKYNVWSTCKGLTRIRPLSCGFDSSVGRALHRHRKVVGSNPAQSLNFFQVSVPVVLPPHLH